MSESTENIRLQLKRGEKGSFDIKNCSAVLAYGEPFWDLDNKNLYIVPDNRSFFCLFASYVCAVT